MADEFVLRVPSEEEMALADVHDEVVWVERLTMGGKISSLAVFCSESCIPTYPDESGRRKLQKMPKSVVKECLFVHGMDSDDTPISSTDDGFLVCDWCSRKFK